MYSDTDSRRKTDNSSIETNSIQTNQTGDNFEFDDSDFDSYFTLSEYIDNEFESIEYFDSEYDTDLDTLDAIEILERLEIESSETLWDENLTREESEERINILLIIWTILLLITAVSMLTYTKEPEPCIPKLPCIPDTKDSKGKFEVVNKALYLLLRFIFY